MWNGGEITLRLPGARSLVDSDTQDTVDTLVHQGAGDAIEKDVFGEYQGFILAFSPRTHSSHVFADRSYGSVWHPFLASCNTFLYENFSEF